MNCDIIITLTPGEVEMANRFNTIEIFLEKRLEIYSDKCRDSHEQLLDIGWLGPKQIQFFVRDAASYEIYNYLYKAIKTGKYVTVQDLVRIETSRVLGLLAVADLTNQVELQKLQIWADLVQELGEL